MNIFILSTDPRECAQLHADQHVGKMLVEACQLLCDAHPDAPYRHTHVNHPCAVWARSSLGRYCWLAQLAIELSDEWEYRFGKRHASRDVAEWALDAPEHMLLMSPEIEPFAQAMPQHYRASSAVTAYRAYYAAEKRVLLGAPAKWTKRATPAWFSAASALT